MIPATYATLLGFGLITAALATVFFSPYRHWLGFMFAGMLFWGMLEVVRFSMQAVFDLTIAYSYLIAMSVVLLSFIAILLREDQRAHKAQLNRRYMEHTPVYDDE